MAYEFAQHVLDQLATATEIFAAGYVGINFVIYSWKRAESESSLTQPTVIPETTAVPEAPLEVLQPLPLSLPKRELVEIAATTSTEATPMRQLVDLNESPRPAAPLPSVNLTPAPAHLPDASEDDLVEAESESPALVPQALTPEATAIADTTEAKTGQPQPVSEPTPEPPVTKPVLKTPPVRPGNLGQSNIARATSQTTQAEDKLTEED
ncbi:hypothetical protein ACN4EK_27555 [Pantanalinema rosaneae CENA516]|uniref:hypothetical protein n=1 Tax=Pantanalinema rosaneae TaxID=1620701 RepID=UPI003D6E244F